MNIFEKKAFTTFCLKNDYTTALVDQEHYRFFDSEASKYKALPNKFLVRFELVMRHASLIKKTSMECHHKAEGIWIISLLGRGKAITDSYFTMTGLKKETKWGKFLFCFILLF